MFPPIKHKTNSRNPSGQGTDIRPQKDRAYVHFADDDLRVPGDPNLKYTDETNAYTTVSTRGHFTPNPRTTNYNTTSLGRQHNSPPPSDGAWELISDGPKTDKLGMQDRGQDYARVPLSARSYEISPSRKRQPSPRQSQGPLADKIGKGEENNTREVASRDTNPSTLVCECLVLFLYKLFHRMIYFVVSDTGILGLLPV